jgi:hypothetical protein
VNIASCSVSSLFAFSKLSNLASYRLWLNSMQLLSWASSSSTAFAPFVSFATSILVLDAAYLSAIIIVLLSEIPLCNSEQYLPYSVKV